MRGRQLICVDKRRIIIEDFDLAPLANDEILVQNDCTAVSVGTEVYNWIHGSEPHGTPVFPHKTGYCSTGTVVEVGKEITDVQVGDRVAAQGSHASHNIMRSHYHRVTDGVDAEDAVFLVLAAIALHGVRKGRIELGESVAVIGAGLVGQLALSLAHIDGALPLISLDLDDARLARAQARGADAVINPDRCDDVVAQVRALCPDEGANAVIEATGKPAVYPMAAKLACRAGRVVALGSPRGTVEMDFMADVHLREVDIIGAIQPITPEEDHLYYHWTKDRDRRLLLELMVRGRLQIADLITHRCAPEQCQTVYEMLADRPQEALGVVFRWD
jgi:2-desacetyl-2-hydroxyethyl bacteriochlorophyllide A dehydrogenase